MSILEGGIYSKEWGCLPISFPCPICGQAMPVTNDLYDSFQGPLCEQSYACPTEGHYDYEFSYGPHRLLVGEREWIWSHGETDEEAAIRRADIESVIMIMKGGAR